MAKKSKRAFDDVPSPEERYVYVYVLSCPRTKLVKIGVSTSPQNRASELRAEVAHEFATVSEKVANKVERECQSALRRCAVYHPDHIGRSGGAHEWFKTTTTRAIEVVRTAAEAVGCELDVRAFERTKDRVATSKVPVRMSLRAFGRAVGITESGVRKAIRSGRIPQDALGKDERTGWPYVSDAALAARHWAGSSRAPRGLFVSRGEEYSTLPDDVRNVRMLRDLKLIKLADAKAEVAMLQKARLQKRVVVIDSMMALVSTVAEQLIQTDPGDKRTVRRVVRKFEQAILADLKNRQESSDVR